MKSNSTVRKNYPTHDERLNTIAKLCADRIGDLLDSLNVEVNVSGNKFVGCCPIHGDSDNPASLNIYYEGYSVPGYWKCRTRSCQDKFGKNIIGFTRGRLSSMKLGYHWKKKPEAIFGFPGTLDYLCKFLGVKLESIKIDEKEQERRRFIAECSQLEKVYKHQNSTVNRQKVRNSLIIPSEYFLGRGYSKEVLDTYDIGMAKKPKQDTQERVIVPIYNEEEYLVGYTCRSVFDRCLDCKLFHNPDRACPILDMEKNLCSKWRHVGFEANNQLYNYWKAKEYIKNTGTAVLVEGPGDVWKLEQNGIHNSVAMFGHSLYDGQERLLANAQCMAIIVLTDNDQAGIKGAQEIKNKYSRLYRIYFPNIKEKDVGEMNEYAITENVRPYLDIAQRLYK